MKRIIEGVTYNTDTATLIAEATHEDEDKGSIREGSLYQTRTGVYFFVDKVTTSYRDRHSDIQRREHYDWEAVGDAAAAREFCEQYSMTILRDIEDMPPEAELGEKLATLYVRLPPNLKKAVKDTAERSGVSENTAAMRCLERCVSLSDGTYTALEPLAKIWWISAHFRSISDGEWSRATMIQAFDEIAELADGLATTLTGDARAMTELPSRLSGSRDFDELNRKYEPFPQIPRMS